MLSIVSCALLNAEGKPGNEGTGPSCPESLVDWRDSEELASGWGGAQPPAVPAAGATKTVPSPLQGPRL